MSATFRRINIMVRSDQYERIAAAGLPLSGLLRNLIDDHFSETRVVLSLTKESKRFYDHIVGHFGITDQELEPYIVAGLEKFLEERSRELEKLRKQLRQFVKSSSKAD